MDALEQWRMKRVLEMVKLAKEIQLNQHEAILEYTTFGQKLAAEQRAKQHEINKMEIEEHRLKIPPEYKKEFSLLSADFKFFHKFE